MIAGQIEIQMLADLARLQSDMDNASSMVGGAMSKVEAAVGGAMRVLGALGLGLSVGAIASWAEGVINAAGNMNDLAIRTGAAVEELSRFEQIGRTSGTSADSIAGAMDRLAKNTALVDDESKLAVVAMQALGLSLDEFKAMKPDEQLMAVAKALAEYEDGASKSAAAQALLGKEGPKLLPFLKDLATDTETVATITKTQAENADALADKFEAWKAKAQGVAGSYVLELLPALDKMSGLIVPIAETTALYFGLFVGVPALFGAATVAFDAVMLSLSGLNVAAATATTQLGLLTTAAGILVGAFMGWQIGTWLRENFLEAQLAGIAFVEGTMLAWERLKLVALSAWAVIESGWNTALSGMGELMSGFLTRVSGGLSALGMDDAAAKVLTWAGNVKTATTNTGDLATKLGALKGDYDRAAGKIRDTTGDMADYATQAFKNKDANEKHGKSADELAKQVDAARRAIEAKKEADKLAEAAARAHKEEVKKQDAAYLALKGKVEDLMLKMQAEEEQGAKLSEAQKLAMEVTKAVKDGVMGLSAERQAEIEKMVAQALQMEAVKAATEREREAVRLTKEEREKATGQVHAHAGELEAEAGKIEAENAAIGKTKEQLELLRLQRLDEELRVAQAIVDKDALMGKCDDETAAHERTLDALKRLHQATEDKIYLTAAQAASDAWGKTADDIARDLTDSFFRAFESGKSFFSSLWDGIKNTIKNTVLKIGIDVVTNFVKGAVNSVIGGVLGTGSGAASAGGITSSIGGLGSAYNAASGAYSWLTGGAAAGATATGLGATGSYSMIGGALTETGVGSTLATTLGTTGSSLGSMAAAAGPYIAAAIAIYAIAKSLEGGETRQGGQYQYGDTPLGDGRSGFLSGPSGGQIAGDQVQQAIGATVASINSLLKDAGSAAELKGFQAALESSNNGRGGVYSGGTLSTGATFGELGLGGGRSNYNGTLYEQTSSQTVDSKTALDNFSVDLMQAQIQALQAVNDLPENIAAVVRGVNAEALSAAQATELIGKVASLIKERKDAEAAAAEAAAAAEKAAADAAAAAAAPAVVSTAMEAWGTSVMSGITPQQYDDGVQSLRTLLARLADEVSVFRSDNTDENTRLLRLQMEAMDASADVFTEWASAGVSSEQGEAMVDLLGGIERRLASMEQRLVGIDDKTATVAEEARTSADVLVRVAGTAGGNAFSTVAAA